MLCERLRESACIVLAQNSLTCVCFIKIPSILLLLYKKLSLEIMICLNSTSGTILTP